MANGMRIDPKGLPLHMQEQVAISLVRPDGGNSLGENVSRAYNAAAEDQFRKGEEHMRGKIIACLMEHKTQAKCLCHACIVECIRMVEKL